MSKKSKIKDPRILDLHGVRHRDVDRLVENFVLLEEPPLTIICGNSDKMPKMITTILDRHSIDWDRWSHGVFKIC
jgi:hypothetical protein